MACLIVVDLPLLLWPVFIGFPPRLWPVFDWQEKRDNDDEHDEPLESGATYSQKTAQSVIHMSFKCPQAIPLVSHLCNKGALAQKKAVICHVEGLGCDQIV